MRAADDGLLPAGDGVVTLRRLRVADLPLFQGYRHDPKVARFQGWTPLDDDGARAFLADVASAPLLQRGHWSQVAVTRTADDTLCGDLGLFVSDDAAQAEIGFTLAREHQGQGLATRAVRLALALLFGRTPVAQVVAITDARNAPSIALLERLGFALASSTDTVFRGEPCTELGFVLPAPAGRRTAP
jgi:RimJ/RimL family protein N-acetyltransferase